MYLLLGSLLTVVLIANAVPTYYDKIVDSKINGRSSTSTLKKNPQLDIRKVHALQQGLPTSNIVASITCIKHVVVANSTKLTSCIDPPVSHQEVIKPMLENISVCNMQMQLDHLAGFFTRYYKSPMGLLASNYVLDIVRGVAGDASRSDVSVTAFNHNWSQPSIIARIPGSSPLLPIVILGAHFDSINAKDPDNGQAPGADDDGTGTVNLIEAFRTLLMGGFRPSHPVEFHWYAAEEGGLLGSRDIATTYKNANAEVLGYMNLDETGYFKPGTREVIAMQPAFTNGELNVFLQALITNYTRLPFVMDIEASGQATQVLQCNYTCADHATWGLLGYPTTFPYEAMIGYGTRSLHTAEDTPDKVNWTHSVEFTKLAVAFAYELGI
ncbi:hypothetical protein AMATHDRAFT_46806 [Amanita thiersii Skay4041]|uniref:Peptide hydrolase n=1 Tax=Amanita thiersii Skay4041 TaxID=703135 RepID=A0A2A9NVX0_9AGAR|nr:hypothetical protein AMATHDRAFT_46806 [Amanita thiersii Skay4041]